MKKIEKVVTTYRATCDAIQQPEEWHRFLKTACWNYKLGFEEQVLVYAQKPEATAVLELKQWNSQFHRWINRGADGIATFDKENGVKYYFDISDTHEGRNAIPVPLWKMRSRYESAVIETLENSFGELQSKESFPAVIVSAVENAVVDNLKDYASQVAQNRESTSLSEFDDEETELLFQQLVSNSVSYMVLTRCGCNPDDCLGKKAFNDVELFVAHQTVSIMGKAVSAISEMTLSEIASTVRALQNEERQNQSERNEGGQSYDQDAERTSAEELREREERSSLHSEGGLLLPGNLSGRSGATEIRHEPVGQDEGGLPGTSQDKRVRGDEADLHVITSSERDAGTGRRNDGKPGEEDDGEGRLNGGTEAEGPNEMGGVDEQYSPLSGRDRPGNVDLRLTDRESDENFIVDKKAEAKNASAFAFPQEVIDEVLQQGSGVFQGKFRIYEQVQRNISLTEFAKFLSSEYGTGGKAPAITGTDIHEDHNRQGIQLRRGWGDDAPTINLKWNEVAKRITQLVAADRYLNRKEKDEYVEADLTDWLAAQKHDQVQAAEQKNEDSRYVYEYHLGDKVFLGINEYEVLSFDENIVQLYDVNAPLFKKEMPRPEFDTKVQENPVNDHLKVLVAERQPGYEEWSEPATPENAPDEVKVPSDNIAEYLPPASGKKPAEAKSHEAEEKVASYEHIVGERLIIDNRDYIVESVGKISGDVRLKDITFQSAVGFPIDRVEKIGRVLAILDAAKEQEIIVPAWEQMPEEKGAELPNAPMENRYNYHITDNELGVGGAKEKYRRNIAAINLLHDLESEKRLATPEEQEILSKYVGWGGLADAFDESKSAWANEYTELNAALSPDEYAQARESTLTAFYTPPVVIKSIYQALENMGFKDGNILEPACGTGNFMGLLPDSMSESKMYGVELDSVSGRIARQLYQRNNIAVQGFETTNLPDSFFDAAIGNVPFGQFKVADKKYDKHNFLIHDFFFAKSLDKVRPGGVVAFITSKGTLDKDNPAVRKYIAQRADLLGAIRLPNNTFTQNAGTDVTSDIIFLQKRDRLINYEPNWVHLGKTEDGITVNQYFLDHPDMILGDLAMTSTQFGMDSTCKPYEGESLEGLLADAVMQIHAEIAEYEEEKTEGEEDLSISADPSIRNFSFTVYDGEIYFRENSRMFPCDVSVTAENRIKGMIEIRDSVRKLIELQTEDYPDADIKAGRDDLNKVYDAFTAQYGRINTRANISAFSKDSSFPLLNSLELYDEKGNFAGKADMFHKRTIKAYHPVLSVDTASEALAVCLAEKAHVDVSFMAALASKTEEEILEDLNGVIFRVPAPLDEQGNAQYQTADEYLSGNVREKLKVAVNAADVSDLFWPNVEALKKVQPQDLSASEIDVRLGATWIPADIYSQFMFELLETPFYRQYNIKVNYTAYTASWNIDGKGSDSGNINAFSTYGTDRINAYKIIEETLNLKDVRVYDYLDIDGKRTQTLNRKETIAAQGKQEIIKENFKEWIWEDPVRRSKLECIYNDKFNAIRPREYDGSHLNFVGINPEIILREHQINSVARQLYGGNTLLAHVVGAGKTWSMTAGAMEGKRLGLCQKSIFVVPNHLIDQWPSEFLQLYPAANILVATKKDFETKNRKTFCSRIATGDYDAVFIAHSQFEKIPLSVERQKTVLEDEISEVLEGIDEVKRNRGERTTIKQLEKARKSLQIRLDKLNDQSRKDDVITFEELGVDRLYVDEAHLFKNLFAYTKMRNVAGISQTESQKASDLFMKTKYMDELTGGKGSVFATGTPISNTMVEMFTFQRYLQYAELKKQGLANFDAWASVFGETVTAIELAPEGTGFRTKTRFAKFYNIPELMSMFKEFADVQTADMLDLPVPKANQINVMVKPSEYQSDMVADLSERAEAVRNRMVTPKEDNMLLITNDGRKLALDQRMMNPLLPDDPNSKVNACVENFYSRWTKSKEEKLTQLIFCDLSTPKKDGSFNVYDDIRGKLVAKGVPEEEIQFIHDADTDAKKKVLFAKVRSGDVRCLIGSTAKMGAGMNVQDKLIAIHNLDCPWRPSDLEQRAGRGVRQGNQNKEIDILNYVTEQTFDAYLWQLLENKQKFISQIMTSKSPVRSAEDVDESVLSYAEIKMLATGNPLIKEKMDLDIQVSRLKVLKQSYLSQRYSLENRLVEHFPLSVAYRTGRIDGLESDISSMKEHMGEAGAFMGLVVNDRQYTEKVKAGEAILEACKQKSHPSATPLGSYKGFSMDLAYEDREYVIMLKRSLSYKVILGPDAIGNITRLDNALNGLERLLDAEKTELQNLNNQIANAEKEVKKPFVQEDELKMKMERLNELNVLLSMDQKDPFEVLSEENEETTDNIVRFNNQRQDAEDEELER